MLTVWKFSVETAVGQWFAVVGYGALKTARTLDWTTTLASGRWRRHGQKSTHDGMQRTLEDFQFDLENALAMSQLTD